MIDLKFLSLKWGGKFYIHLRKKSGGNRKDVMNIHKQKDFTIHGQITFYPAVLKLPLLKPYNDIL